MAVRLEARTGFLSGPIPPLHTFRNPFLPKRTQIQTSNFRMLTQSASAKRPVCPSCSKPARTCLCHRLRAPPLDNSVAVTILQHSLEKKHPLNSARIATLGLKNVDVVAVSDVNFQARFFIRSVDRHELGNTRHMFDEMPSRGKDAEKSNFTFAFDFTIGKYGAIVTGFDQLLNLDVSRNGFIVKKLQMGAGQSEEIEEFEIVVRPGSALLFPSEGSVVAGELNFGVENLIVLDGTWAKARRMYSENPWLSMLPHVRLDLRELSLYGEVRHQPKAGYLSTIESIVYAMKAVGEEDSEALDGLLDVFGSMVGDQRRCKNERLNEASRK